MGADPVTLHKQTATRATYRAERATTRSAGGNRRERTPHDSPRAFGSLRHLLCPVLRISARPLGGCTAFSTSPSVSRNTLATLQYHQCRTGAHGAGLVRLPVVGHVVRERVVRVRGRQQRLEPRALLSTERRHGRNLTTGGRTWMLSSTVRICSAGDHLSLRMSRQMRPSLSMLGW